MCMVQCWEITKAQRSKKEIANQTGLVFSLRHFCLRFELRVCFVFVFVCVFLRVITIININKIYKLCVV